MTMDRRGITLLCVGFVVVASLSQVSGQQPQVTDSCLVCICETITNCNRTLTCSGNACGMFRITWAYWADAGKPVLEGDSIDSNGAYPRCVTEPSCAARTVRGYMAKFGQDCNGDQVVDCYDFARIHILGGYGCGEGLPPHYSQKFNYCMSQVQAVFGSIP